MVMTPEGRGPSAAGITTGSPAAPFRAGAAAIRVGHGREPLGLDVFPAPRAVRVTARSQAPQRRLDLLQLRLSRARDRAEDIVVLALCHLLGKVGRQRIRFVAQIRARLACPLTQLVPAFEQSLPYRVGVHESPGKNGSRQDGRWPRRLSSSHFCSWSKGSTNFATPSRSSCCGPPSRSPSSRSSPSRASLASAR